MRIIAEIPARAGSKRVKNKNLRLLNGKPMISYVIEEAKKSKMLTDVYVNSDCDKIGKFAKDLGVKFYKRPIDLGGDFTTSDEYNYDFINSISPDILVQINPVCPLIESDDIDNIIKHFVDNNFDSLVTVKEERLQAFCDGKPVNFDGSENGTLCPQACPPRKKPPCVFSKCRKPDPLTNPDLVMGTDGMIVKNIIQEKAIADNNSNEIVNFQGEREAPQNPLFRPRQRRPQPRQLPRNERI